MIGKHSRPGWRVTAMRAVREIGGLTPAVTLREGDLGDHGGRSGSRFGLVR